MQRIKLSGLDATRCYAALSIVLFHLVHMAKLDVPEPANFIETHFGFGVPLFYMVSAFGLFLGYENKLQELGAWKEYYLRRFFRIAPLFYFVVLFYIPYLWLLYDGHLVPITKVVSSVLFVFNFIPQDVEGFVWASWSIGVEMVFYLLLPLLVLLVRGLGSAFAFFILSIYIKTRWNTSFDGITDSAVMTNFKTYFFLAHVHYFAMGILSYFIWSSLYNSRLSVRLNGLLFTVISISGLILLVFYSSEITGAFGHVFDGFYTRFAYGLSFAWCLAGLIVGLCLWPTLVLVNRVSCSLGRTSFSLYLWHPVVIGLLMKLSIYAFLYSNFGGLLIPGLLSVVITLAILIPISYLSFNFIEIPGMKAAKRFI